MYNARFETYDGKSFNLGFRHGIVFDISPLTELNVDVATSQGFQQVGDTVEGVSVGGVSRTIYGKIFKDVNENKNKLLRAFTPFAKGKLYFNGVYFCDAVVQKTPALSVGDKFASFSLMLFCPNPYWLKAKENSFSIGGYSKAFSFPINYAKPHSFGIKNPSAFLNCKNNGTASVPFKVVFSTEFDVTNFGITNIYTLQKIKINDTMNAGERIEVYRDNGRLKVEKYLGETVTDIFAKLDEESDLFTMEIGDNVITAFAEDGLENLRVDVTFSEAYSGVYDGM